MSDMKSLLRRSAKVVRGLLAGGVLLAVSGCGAEGSDDEQLGSVEQALITVCPAGYPNNGGIIINGTNGIDNLVGTAGGDCIFGFNGPDIIDGAGGDDFIAGGSGDDTIHGGDGNDYIRGETGTDTIFGDAGGDRLLGDEEDDFLDGGDGDDVVKGGIGNDELHGGAGNDSVEGEPGNDVEFGEAGADNVKGGDGNDVIEGGAGIDYLEGNNGDDTVSGGTEDDKVYGFAGNDTLNGDDGNDLMFGGNDDDVLNGGVGNDTLNGEAGADQLNGGIGDDTLNGSIGNDILHGDDGNDRLFGDADNDQLFGDDGDDRLVGGAGVDTISGGSGNDLANETDSVGSVAGDVGNDATVLAATMTGGNGTDACSGMSCELPSPVANCTGCGARRRCATEVGFCIYCQSDSECLAGQQCVPTVGCQPAETNCTNGLDDDNDGDVDCADTDCSASCSGKTTFGGGAGNWHQCALNSSGQVACWGRNNLCQLGNPGETNVPRVVAGLTNPTMVRTGSYNTCAVEAGGTVKCWGSSTDGALGDGGVFTGNCSGVPVTVSGLSGVTQVSTGEYFACAVVGSPGPVYCWGRNIHGNLGNGTAVKSNVPVQVSGITTATAVSAGIQHACALLANGTVACWGRNNRGQVGANFVGGSYIAPATVSGLTGAVSISAGQEYSCSVIRVGGATSLRCWGDNAFGQMGRGTTGGTFGTPQTVLITSPIAVEAGARHACALRQGGEVRCWGLDDEGNVGAGSAAGARPSPVLTSPPLSGMNQLAMGRGISCARNASGAVYCWGDNLYGQVAADSPTDHASPILKGGI